MTPTIFSEDYLPTAQRGFTPIEAVEFSKREFPGVSDWTCWMPGYLVARSLGMIPGKGYQTEGSIGTWTWSRVPCGYPALSLWNGEATDLSRGDDWVGVVKVRGLQNEQFLLFSFLNSVGSVGQWYLASTHDVQLLHRFGKDVYHHFNPPDRLIIRVYGGPDLVLNPADEERIFLPTALIHDVECQVYSFFANGERYRQLGLRHRRGFLFVGCPGVGKTLLLRHLIRECHRRYQVPALLLESAKNTTDFDLTTFFHEAERYAPCLVVLEDLDSLTTESQISRARLLAELDGLSAKAGLLIIGSTNHPDDIDPAFVHRPSRFDRVWTFPLPDLEMRRQYLAWAFPGLDQDTFDSLAEQTTSWSYAYLNELRTTATILAIDGAASELTADNVTKAFGCLAAQFQAGRKNHVVATPDSVSGFHAA